MRTHLLSDVSKRRLLSKAMTATIAGLAIGGWSSMAAARQSQSKSSPPPGLAIGQLASDNQIVEQYLESYLKKYNDRFATLNNRFSGKLTALPEELSKKLDVEFPRHRFVIAQTYFSHWSPDDGTANILLVINRRTGRVDAHKWAMWFSGESRSFCKLLTGYQNSTQKDALERVRVLAELIVSMTSDGGVGSVRIEGGQVLAELNRGDDLYRVMKVPLKRKFRFGRITFLDSDMKRADE